MRLKKLYRKLIILWKVLKGKDEHFVYLSLNRKHYINMLKGEDFCCSVMQKGFNNYSLHLFYRMLVTLKDDIDLDLSKRLILAEMPEEKRKVYENWLENINLK